MGSKLLRSTRALVLPTPGRHAFNSWGQDDIPLEYALGTTSTGSQVINQYSLQKLDNRIIDLDAALHMYTGNTRGLEQCISSEFWPIMLKPWT